MVHIRSNLPLHIKYTLYSTPIYGKSPTYVKMNQFLHNVLAGDKDKIFLPFGLVVTSRREHAIEYIFVLNL